jgi:phosphopantothenoylcysteine decarboxylase / phosphopantothenate---cysteine ligase
MLKGKKITVGITGGIAAYKAAEIVSWLHAEGADVQVAMTKSACEIITPLTMKTLSGKPVLTDIMDKSGFWHVPHIDLANCDLYVLVPATANIMAKAATGIADELISASLLATTAPVLCAPSMNNKMYEHPATQHNMAVLRERGWIMVEPDSGRLACGTQGKGRFPEPQIIKDAVLAALTPQQSLSGKKVLVSAGPTHEYLDPVRFISNASSGKMGYALAETAAQAGAEVTLVSGPVSLTAPPGVMVINIGSALEMEAALNEEFAASDIVIMTAAVADYRPAKTAANKIKKEQLDARLELVKNPDILAGLGKKKNKQFLVGFAAETDNLEQYARQKLIEKNLDLIIANNVAEIGAGFGGDTNIITAIYGGQSESYPLMSKKEAAAKIIALIVKLYGKS